MTAASAAFIADCIEQHRTTRAYLNPHLKNTRSDTVAHAPAAACHVTSTNTTRTRKPAARTRFAALSREWVGLNAAGVRSAPVHFAVFHVFNAQVVDGEIGR